MALAMIVMLAGCDSPMPQAAAKPVMPDCVNEPFHYDFYSHDDQIRLTYCYATLQSIAREKH